MACLTLSRLFPMWPSSYLAGRTFISGVPDNSKLIQIDISPPTVAKEAERETPE
jgi:hypothetical protein